MERAIKVFHKLSFPVFQAAQLWLNVVISWTYTLSSFPRQLLHRCFSVDISFLIPAPAAALGYSFFYHLTPYSHVAIHVPTFH